MNDPFQVVRDFELEISRYTGAPYAVVVDTCTAALTLCCAYLKVQEVRIPKHTYISVPMAVIQGGGAVKFDDREWAGQYQLEPYPIYDSALRFRANMYQAGTYQCVSFSVRKCLPVGRGGAILTDDPEAVQWLRLARFNGREECSLRDQKDITVCGWNFYMEPERAARGLRLLFHLKPDNPDTVEEYPDLSKFSVFR